MEWFAEILIDIPTFCQIKTGSDAFKILVHAYLACQKIRVKKQAILFMNSVNYIRKGNSHDYNLNIAFNLLNTCTQKTHAINLDFIQIGYMPICLY